MQNPNDRITDNTVAPGSAAKELSQFTLDCSKTGPNYVLTYMYLVRGHNRFQLKYPLICSYVYIYIYIYIYSLCNVKMI